MISITVVLGIVFSLLLISVAGIYAKSKVRNAKDFTTGSNMSLSMVAGSLIGTLVGGASTIGTAQLAYQYGFSAWWFTLGGGIGLVILAAFFAKPLFENNYSTIPQVLSREYGRKIATVAAVLMSVGTFISIVSQLLSGVALVTSVYTMPSLVAVAVVILLMTFYVICGGAVGAGMAGIVKTVLLYMATLICGLKAIDLAGGVKAFSDVLPRAQYFNLFARGFLIDAGSGASLIFGVLTTQAYIFPIVSAKSLKVSKGGAILGGVLTSVIGISGIFVGMYMRIYYPDIRSAEALPLFVRNCLPQFIGGVVLGTLLIALVGTGAGLALGIGSMLCNDIYKPLIRPQATEKELLLFSRVAILFVFFFAALLSLGNIGSMILNWSFLSMGLRGAVAFAPLCFALFFPSRLPAKVVVASMVIGPLAVLIGKFLLPKGLDPLFHGMAVSILICIGGRWLQKK